MMLDDECPECLTKSMSRAYVHNVGEIDYCGFCKDGWVTGKKWWKISFLPRWARVDRINP